jgi:hypothetical protein
MIKIYRKKDNDYCKAIETCQVEAIYIKDDFFVIVTEYPTVYKYELELYKIVIE